jgi:hypothetical protein
LATHSYRRNCITNIFHHWSCFYTNWHWIASLFQQCYTLIFIFKIFFLNLINIFYSLGKRICWRLHWLCEHKLP